jgi:hypothetical protein
MCFIKFFITDPLLLCRSHVKPCHIYRELRQSAHSLQEPTAIEEDTYVFNSTIMSYILNRLICVGIILLDNLLQWFLLIVVIDLSRTCEDTTILIYNLLVMFMSYFGLN